MAEVIDENKLLIDTESQLKFLLTFAVDQVDEFWTRLKDKGVVFLNELHDRQAWNARAAHLRDLDGNVINYTLLLRFKCCSIRKLSVFTIQTSC